ncbi:MAG: hypothetical protein K2L36_05880 [Eubacterium sp.]|nr:hypothetical protein [Eubacterium sp.]
MKIKCYLTDATEYNQFCCSENGVYTLKISKNSNSWYYDLCDLIDFYKNSNTQIILDITEADVVLARRLYKNHKYNECSLREYETKVLVHSTPIENLENILKSRKLKSWNILKQETPDWEKEPIGKQLGDIDDFSNYVMLSMLFQNNEIITASKQKHRVNIDVNQLYTPGVRFYLNAEKLAADGLLLRDGEHIKVKDFIPLDKYLIWYSTAEKLGIKKEWTPKEFFELSNKKFSELY